MLYSAPKKSLGQNFLTSIPARIAIVKAGNLTPSDTVLEIGPGKGFLTKGLLESGASVVVLEKDSDLIPVLKETFADEIKTSHLTVIEGDTLVFEPSGYKLLATSYKLVANIPYYITGAILSHFLSNKHQPTQMVVLVQKEVAERICEKKGSKTYGILSVLTQAFYDAEYLFTVGEHVFNPPPKVKSGVIRCVRKPKELWPNCSEKSLFIVVKTAFNQRRKMLSNTLKSLTFVEEIPKEWQTLRPEQLTLEQFVAIAQRLA